MNEFYSPPAFDARVEARRAEILREMEEYKDTLMREMSLLDKATLTRLRSFLANSGVANTVTVERVEETLDSGGTNVVYFSDGSILCIRNGKDGGGNGDGKGITIVNVSESSESGGENIVTFSDGTTLTIRNGANGKDGADGYGSITDYGLPDYWSSYLTPKIATIKNRQTVGGRNTFSYIIMTDMHYAQQKAHYTGKIAKRIMDECNIPFAISLGDNVSRGTIVDMSACDAEFDGYWSIVAPIADKLLCTQGNHDGYYNDGSSRYYTVEDALDRVYSGMKVATPTVWDENGAGYYVDDCANRVRYIGLNTCSRGSLTGELPANAPYMSVFRYTQSQFDMVVGALTSIPNNRWRVVVCSHVVPIWEVDRFGDGVKVTNIESQFADATCMLKVLNAYVTRSAITVSHTDDLGEWANVSVTADFSNAKGSLVMYSGGHYHVDKVWATDEIVNGGIPLKYPVTLHRCDSFNENQGSLSEIETTLENERVVGTTTEHCFDVVTVDPDNGFVYCTRIGAGNDRVISIGGTGNDEGDETTVYTVTTNFTNCGWDFEGDTIEHGSPLYAIFSSIDGYGDPSVTVTMGGVDITDDVYADNEINIPSVTGNVVVSATATKPAYTITFNLTNVTAQKGAPSVSHGGGYSTFLTPSDGYTLDYSSVTVTMGGTDITGTAFDTHTRFVTIDSVTGDIVITATATNVITVTNYADPSSDEWVENGRLSQSGSSVSTLEGGVVTNYIPCKVGDVIHITGMNPLWGDVACTANAAAAWFADSNKTKIGAIVLVSNLADGAVVRNGSDFDVEYIVGGYKADATNNYLPTDMNAIAYMRFCGHITGSASDVVITVNE